MNNKNELNHGEIKQLLDRSLVQLERPTLARLRHAREQALTHYATRCAEPVLFRAGHAIWHAFGTRNRPRLLVATLLLATILFGATTYWSPAAKPDTSDIDIAILTDDFPIHYYVD